jgi:2-alkenal reductase
MNACPHSTRLIPFTHGWQSLIVLDEKQVRMNYQNPSTPVRAGRRAARWAAPAVLSAALFFAGTAALSIQASQQAGAPARSAGTVRVFQPAQVATPITPDEALYSSIYSETAQSVVSINVVARVQGRGTEGFGFEDEFAEGTGTGFVIDTQGHIVTNNHVIDGAQRIEVNFFDGRIVRGEIVGVDPDSDLAVIRVDDVPTEALRPVTFADSDGLFIGQEVVAIGSPFNQPWTLTTGIISALNRQIYGLTNFSIGSVIQTDAAINPGNSGGPLLNLAGDVIGVNSQIISRTRSSAGIGFAIPSNLVQRVAASLIENGRVEYSYLGIGGDDVNLYYIEALDLPNDTRGVVVSAVQRNSPAARSGLQEPSGSVVIDGVNVPTRIDIITAIDGTPISGMQSLVGYLASNTVPGQSIMLSVLRDGRETLQLPVTLALRDSGS